MVFAGECFKHSKQWRSRLEWLTNQLRVKRKDEILANQLKIEQFVRAFSNLICTCAIDGNKKPHLKEINVEIWRIVSDEQFKQSVETLKNYRADPEIKQSIVDNLLKLLYGRHGLSEVEFEHGMEGAVRMTFLVSRIIYNDFSFIQRYENELKKRQPKVFNVDLLDLPVDQMDVLTNQGPTGSLLERFNNDNRCQVTLQKVPREYSADVVSATIKKTVNEEGEFDEVAECLRRLAREAVTKASQMGVDRAVSSTQSMSGVEPQRSNDTQPFIPQTTRMAELKDDQSSTSLQAHLPAVRNQSAQSSIETETQSSLCLVHSPQWLSTFQFVLTQCISHNLLHALDGHNFSEKVCTCNDAQRNTDITQYIRYTNEADIQNKIQLVKDELKTWRNGIIVIQKLMTEMETEHARTWQSLLRFVHEFLELKTSGRNGAPRSVFGNR